MKCFLTWQFVTARVLFGCVVDLAGPERWRVPLQVKRITPRHLQLAIRGDEELDTLIKVCMNAETLHDSN